MPTTKLHLQNSQIHTQARTASVLIALLVSLMVNSGCSSTNPYYNPEKPHHRPDGFVNSNGDRIKKKWTDVLRWYQEHYGKSLPAPPNTMIQGYEGFKVHQFNREQWQSYGATSATWLGHATVLLRVQDLHVLTDPHFSERASPVQWAGPRRKIPSPLKNIDDLPRIDVVMISHNHHDHLDKESLLALAKTQPHILFLVPLGLEKTLASWGIQQVSALDWWEHRTYKGTEFTLVPAQHWSSRSLLDANETLWGGWAMKHPQFNFYFSGDTGYNKQDFRTIGQRLGPFDLSAIAVGAYEPRWFMKDQHINPEEAVQIHLDVRSRQSIGVHWGTFELTSEALDQPLLDLQKAKQKQGVEEKSFLMLEHGQTLKL